MNFLAPALLGGIALVALPIILHLVMRREPKKVEFPALRFVRTRQSSNQHRLRLRHWLLLALRTAFVMLLALGLARPVLRGSGLLGEGDAGLAAALVFDNSPRMEYLQKNKTRLDEAKETASWLLEQLPIESEVAVVDPSRARRAKLADRDATILRTGRLRITPTAVPLADAVIEAITLVNERPDHRREVYVFTDVSRAAWNDAALAQIGVALDKADGVKLYLVDVGADDPQNSGLGQLELSAERLAAGETLTIQTEVIQVGAVSSNSDVELWIEDDDGELQKRGEQSTAEKSTVELPVAGLSEGLHQGYLRLVGDDPLPGDNTRYFTVDVVAPPRVLLVGQHRDDTRLLSEALAPSALSQTAAPRFTIDSLTYDRLTAETLTSYDALALLDPPPLPKESWRRLTDFVQSGGGVAMFLGRNAVGHLEDFNGADARLLMPAELKWVSTSARSLQPLSYEHPVFAGLADIGPATPWPAFPVFKSWQLGQLDKAATLVAGFADGSPAIVEGVFGTGRVLLVATPVSDRANDDPWNLLPTNPDPWPFLALAEGMVDYLVGAATQPLNHQAGSMVVVPLPRRADLATYVLKRPSGQPMSQSISPGQPDIVVSSTDEVGNYRVVSGGQAGTLDRGFSINTSPDAGQLTRQEFSTIAAGLGSSRVELAKSRSSLSSSINLGRVGRELYPWLIVLVALVLGCEQWLADRFYRGRG